MTAGTYPIVIEQGATFALRLTLRDALDVLVPLPSGTRARMHIRQKVSSVEPLWTLTTEDTRGPGGGPSITLTTPGVIDLYISDENTALFSWKSGVYDLEVAWLDGTVTRVLKGTVTNDPEVTR